METLPGERDVQRSRVATVRARVRVLRLRLGFGRPFGLGPGWLDHRKEQAEIDLRRLVFRAGPELVVLVVEGPEQGVDVVVQDLDRAPCELVEQGGLAFRFFRREAHFTPFRLASRIHKATSAIARSGR